MVQPWFRDARYRRLQDAACIAQLRHPNEIRRVGHPPRGEAPAALRRTIVADLDSVGVLCGVGDALRRYWLPLALTTALLLAGILGAASNYGEAQTASDVTEFKRFVPASEVSDYKLAALIDLLFAAGYGLLALMARSGLATKAGRGLCAARIGCWCVFVAAVLDEIENVLLLWNLANRASIGEFAIEAMTTAGKAKWIFSVFGLVLVAAGLLIRSLWPTMSRTDVRDWLRLAAKPYSAYLGLVVLFVLVTLAHLRWAAALLLVPLLGSGVWLNRIVRESRRQADAGSGNDLGPVRLLSTFIQLACGAALFKWGITEDSRAATAEIPGFDAAIVGRDIAAVFGLALLIMSLGSVISELRQNTRFRGRRAVVLFIVALVLSAGGALVGASIAMLVLFAGAVLVGEFATELAAEDLRRSNPESRSLAERLAVLGVVEVVGVIVLIGMGADPAHALGIAAVLTVVVVLALLDGDVVYVVFLVAVLTFLVTAPYEVDIDDDLRAVADEPYILVLGDSYASGEGAQEYLPGTNEIVPGPTTKTSVNECRQAPTAWGFELARLAARDAISDGGKAFPTRVLFLACSGAVSENIDTEERLGRDGNVHGPAELALYKDAVERLHLDPPALVLVGIGGNDGGFGDLGKTCVGPGNCAEVAEQFLRNRPDRLVDPPPEGQSESLVDIADDLRAAFNNIREVVGEKIPVVATSYPEPVATAGRRCRVRSLRPRSASSSMASHES